MRFQKGDIVPVEVILNELLTPTDEMIEAGVEVLAKHFVSETRSNYKERLKMWKNDFRKVYSKTFTAAIQKALES